MSLAAGFAETVTTGPLLVAAAVAVVVGLVGFLSPCVLPLVPGYLSYMAGVAGEDGPVRRRMVAAALLFVLGFSVIFVVQGAVFGSLGSAIRDHALAIERVLGAVTIIMGLVFLGRIGFLQREIRVHRLPRTGLGGAPVLGAAFGLAWAPCLTPTFSAVYAMSFIEGSAARGAFLTVWYCLGLGVPFVLVALGFGWVSSALGLVRRHARAVSRVGGVMLIVIGLLMMSGQWNAWMDALRAAVGPGSGIQL